MVLLGVLTSIGFMLIVFAIVPLGLEVGSGQYFVVGVNFGLLLSPVFIAFSPFAFIGIGEWVSKRRARRESDE